MMMNDNDDNNGTDDDDNDDRDCNEEYEYMRLFSASAL